MVRRVCCAAAVDGGRGCQATGGTGADEAAACRGRAGVDSHHAANIRGHGTYIASSIAINDSSNRISHLSQLSTQVVANV